MPGQENISTKANQKRLSLNTGGTKYRSGRKESKYRPSERKNNLENKTAKIVQIENKRLSEALGKHVYSIKARNDALSECLSRFVTNIHMYDKGCTSVVTSAESLL